jgi:hypothetical protein
MKATNEIHQVDSAGLTSGILADVYDFMLFSLIPV